MAFRVRLGRGLEGMVLRIHPLNCGLNNSVENLGVAVSYSRNYSRNLDLTFIIYSKLFFIIQLNIREVRKYENFST
jgi:hypothetical protein